MADWQDTQVTLVSPDSSSIDLFIMRKQLFILMAIAHTGSCFSQSLPPFKLLRYEEDYSTLSIDSSSNWYWKTKHQALLKTTNSYVSFGGDIRYQYFRFKNEDWGEAPPDKDGYILTRYLAHADFHFRRDLRAFVQLQSSLANGKETTPSPVEENQLNVHQAFVDAVLCRAEFGTLTARIGRQELLYGSQRLVSVREGPNNRQSFDAAKLTYATTNWKMDALFSYTVPAQRGIFAEGITKTTKFWGTYAVINRVPRVDNVDLYYFGIQKQQATFNDGKAGELRHSIGSRIWSRTNNFRYDVEGIYQFGRFGDKHIDAWTLSMNTGYRFTHLNLRPEIGLKTEVISGDAVLGDNRLQTFNPLFPRGGYFGLASLIGPANLIDIHPSISLIVTPKVSLNVDYDVFWRYSNQDAIYAPNVAIIYLGEGVLAKPIGKQLSTDLVYRPTQFLYFRGEFTWFKAGSFLKAVGPGKDILFTAVTTQLTF